MKYFYQMYTKYYHWHNLQGHTFEEITKCHLGRCWKARDLKRSLWDTIKYFPHSLKELFVLQRWSLFSQTEYVIGKSLIKENSHNSRTSDDVDVKLGLVTKLDKRNKTTSKNLTMTSCRKIVTKLPLFQFMADLKQSGIHIPDK